jgi:hypothetical protein
VELLFACSYPVLRYRALISFLRCTFLMSEPIVCFCLLSFEANLSYRSRCSGSAISSQQLGSLWEIGKTKLYIKTIQIYSRNDLSQKKLIHACATCHCSDLLSIHCRDYILPHVIHLEFICCVGNHILQISLLPKALLNLSPNLD